MRRMVCLFTLVFTLGWSGSLPAAAPEVIWAGGGLKLSDNSNPCFFADTFVLLQQDDGMSLFTQPVLTLKGGEVGFDLGLGGRSLLMGDQLAGGWNVFFDYTSDNSHKRFGAGLEVFHPNATGHLNFYLPVSNEEGGQEALAGMDFQLGVPLPNAAFISIRPGFYYYSGEDDENKSGISLALRIQPIRPLALTIGGRNDALQSGRDTSEIFVRVDFAIPFDRLGRDLFQPYRPEYPLDVRTLLDARVVREEFITYERK
ncbi:MAG TPA: inverse autotransporter beta domain-containing protein [Deltaproteobacteria bacterium]|nr:inverse autotransporter beta domain-containing protein [Deltaproteobacteria bacterium]HOM28429.1 inverse autotransporter beta domain-containing protein [Deltaproteobacteria bacterium]